MPGSFLDTNVLVYLASGDAAKADRAEQIVATGGVISVQVLNEFTNVARRKMRLSWPGGERPGWDLGPAQAASLRARRDTLWLEGMSKIGRLVRGCAFSIPSAGPCSVESYRKNNNYLHERVTLLVSCPRRRPSGSDHVAPRKKTLAGTWRGPKAETFSTIT